MKLGTLLAIIWISLVSTTASADPFHLTILNLKPSQLPSVQSWLFSLAQTQKCDLQVKSSNTWAEPRTLNTITAELVGTMDCSWSLNGRKGAFSGLVTVQNTSAFSRDRAAINLQVDFVNSDGTEVLPMFRDTRVLDVSSGDIE